MSVDKTTLPSMVYITVDDKKEFLDEARKEAQKSGINDSEDGSKYLYFGEGSINTEEYFYDVETNEIQFSGRVSTPNGEVYLSINIPLSDKVLIDVLSGASKKLNKLKTAMESLA